MTSREHDSPGDDRLPAPIPGPESGAGPDDEALDLQSLRAAFFALPVPDATPTLDQSDDETRAAVAWMADVFAALPVPAVVVPTLTAHGPAPRRALITRLPSHGSARRFAARPAPMVMRHAAAAAVFATLALSLWWGRHEQPMTRPLTAGPSGTAQSSAPPDAAIHKVIPGFREAYPGSNGLVAVTNDHLEVSSGPVRLVLLTNGSTRARGPFQDLP